MKNLLLFLLFIPSILSAQILDGKMENTPKAKKISGTTQFRSHKPGQVTGKDSIASINQIDSVIRTLATPLETTQTCLSGAADTTGVSPRKIGDIYVDTSSGKVYISKTASRGGWLILNYIFLPLIFLRRKYA